MMRWSCKAMERFRAAVLTSSSIPSSARKSSKSEPRCLFLGIMLFYQSFAQENDVGGSQDPAHEPGQAPEYSHAEDVQHGGSEEDDNPGLEEGGHLHGAIEGVDAHAQRNADMPVAYLRGI